VDVDDNFPSIIEKLDGRSKTAILNREDPAGKSDIDSLHIRRAILHQVYVKSCFVCSNIVKRIKINVSNIIAIGGHQHL
jgi:hypothetical protein